MELREAYKEFVSKEIYDKAYSCVLHIYNEEKDYELVKEFRKLVGKNREILKKTYLLTAKDYFDDYMIYIEWNRPLKDKYWLPRRAKLLPLCQALQDLEDGKLDELFLSQPPRTGKTTLIMFFLTWVMFRNSERSNLYCSYTDSVVKVLYQGILEVLNDTTTYLWHDVFPQEVASTDAKDLLINIDRRKRYASFTGRSLYGTLNGACDCNGYLIGDDLISGIEEAMNKDRLNNAWQKVDNNMIPRAKQDAKILWIGTRWSLTDPIERRLDVLRNDPKYSTRRFEVVNIPALDEKDESNFDYACGVGFDTEFYQQRRASFERNNDTASWLAQYMGEPIERDGTVFSPDELRYFNGDLPENDPDSIFMAVDPAWGGGDFVASPIIYQYGNDLFVKDVVYSNLEKSFTIPEVCNKAIKNNVTRIYCEGTKMTASYGQEISKLLKSRGYHCNVQISTKHFTGTGKEQRIFDKAPDIRENMVFLDKRDKEYELFMQNVFSFSIMGKNKHDDAPDSLAMAVTFLIRGENIIVAKKRTF